MNGGIFWKCSSNCIRLLICLSFNSPICLLFLAIYISYYVSLIDIVSHSIKFVTIFLYNWCKRSDNKIAWIFTCWWSHAKHSCGCNQSPDTLSCCFKGSFSCFSNCDHVDSCVCGDYVFVKFSYSCREKWQTEHCTFAYIPVMKTCSS